MKIITILTSVLFFGATGIYAQQSPSPNEARMREQLKSLTLRLNTAETAQVTLQNENTELEAKLKTSEEAFAKLVKTTDGEKQAAKEQAEKLNADIAAREKEISATKDLLVKADSFGKTADALAKKTEAERSKLAAENRVLKDTVADHRSKNAKMFAISTEVLSRYEKFGLGTALTAREPFVGITRARLQSMVDEFGGDLAAQRIKLDGTTQKPSPNDRPADGKPAGSKTAAAKP
jgi:hypothetical protein